MQFMTMNAIISNEQQMVEEAIKPPYVPAFESVSM
jgi:hypothetical protein